MPIYMMKRDIGEKMGLNITHTMNNMNFENRESLRNTAKEILNKQGASTEATNSILEKTIFNTQNKGGDFYINPQLAILKASSQISLNNNLKETLKYIKSQAHKKQTKQPVFGELWNLFNEEIEKYEGEMLEFEIDLNAKNIFIAA